MDRCVRACVQTVVIAWMLSFALIVVNTYFLVWTYVDWLVHSDGRLPKYATALLSVVVFALMAAYLVFVVYLTFRRDAVATYVPVSERAQVQVEAGGGAQAVADDDADQPVPLRKDLADASM
jgi:manganese transport protein